MLVTATEWGKRIQTDVLVLGTGASGIGAALRASELKADVLMVGQGRLESSGCLGGGLQPPEARRGRLSPVSGVAFIPQRPFKSLAARGPFSRLRRALSARSDHERHQSQGDAFLPRLPAAVR